jgi:hypothetical protein
MTYENCKLGAVQSQDGGWGFNVLRERGGPAYEAEAKAQEAHDLMTKVIAGAAITPIRECAHAASAEGRTEWKPK